MKPKFLLIVATGLILGADAPKDADAVKDVEKALKALNDAFEKGDRAGAERLMTESHIAITPYYGGPLTRAEQMKALPEHKLTEYGMGAAKITLVSKEVAMVNYPLTLKGTYKGKPLPLKNYATAIWVLQNGKWLETFYQETALDGK